MRLTGSLPGPYGRSRKAEGNPVVGTWGEHILENDVASEILAAMQAEFALPCAVPCGPEEPRWAEARAALDDRGEECLAWACSSRFPLKALARSKEYRVAVIGAALLETGAELSAKAASRFLRDTRTFARNRLGRSVRDLYMLEDLLARFASRVPGVPAVLASSPLDAVVRDAVHDPSHPAARAHHDGARWAVSPGGRVSFAEHGAAYARAPLATDDGMWSPSPDGGRFLSWQPPEGDEDELLGEVRQAVAARPPFNLRLAPEFALWADVAAAETLRAEGRSCAAPLAGIRYRLAEVRAVLDPGPQPEVEAPAPRR